MTEQKKRFECYLNIQKSDGVRGEAVIISGSGETSPEALALFAHALKAALRQHVRGCVRSQFSAWCESMQHKTDHGDVDEGLAAYGLGHKLCDNLPGPAFVMLTPAL